MGNKRTQDRVKQNLGIVQAGRKSPRSRSEDLELIDKYLKSTQYQGKVPWDEAECNESGYIKIRDRVPRIIYPFAKLLCDRLSAKLLGKSVFPKFKIEDDDDTTELLKLIIKQSNFKAKMLTASKQYCAKGSVFVRSKLSKGKIQIEQFDPRWVYPEFDANNDLIFARVQYVYQDEENLDEKGRPIEKWFKMELGTQKDVLFDNPVFKSDEEPTFKVVVVAEHALGFVQGEWLRTEDIKFQVDGVGVVDGITDFIDSLNYNLSQSDRAVSYALDPQLITKGMDEDEVKDLIKSSSKGWHLGREGDANFMEIQGSGIERAEEARDDLSTRIQDIARIVILDPEKTVGHAQSAKAMEVMHAPMVELIDEMRPNLEKGLISLLQKMLATVLIFSGRGAELSIQIPPGYKPKSIDIEASWGEIFPKTIQDLRDKVSVILQLTNANVLSRETGLEKLAKDFEIEDIEAEVQKVNAQPQFNTFGF